MLLTIFTPTFNRSYILPILWESLCKQTNMSFIWLVVDDGSTDDTKFKIQKWQKISPFKIVYAFQKNGGKHVAHNLACHMCQTPLFICVDSDDRLAANAVEKICSYWLCKNSTNIIGWVTRKGDLTGQATGSNWPQKNSELSFIALYESQRFRGETALIWKTSILKKYRFPEIAGEHFMTENVLYYSASLSGNLKTENDIFYLFKYLPDGYTSKGFLLKTANPVGAALEFWVYKNLSMSIIRRFIASVKYYSWVRYFNLNQNSLREIEQSLKVGSRIRRFNGINDLAGRLCALAGKKIIEKHIRKKIN